MSNVSPKGAGLVTLRSVVMSYLNRKQDYSLKSYKRYVQILIEGYGELNLWHLGFGMEVVYLHMTAAKTVALPSDFITYQKIGIPINGKLRVLTNKENILLPRTFDTGEAVGNTDSGDDEGNTDILFFQSHFRGGVFTAGLYGLTGGIDDCYYRVDWENRQIVFSGETPRSEIVLEYFSNGLKPDGSSLIPREAVPALRSYLDFVVTENDPRAAYNEKERKKTLWEEEVSALRHFELSFTSEEFRRAIYSSARQSIKR
jgi:hypothetical protein